MSNSLLCFPRCPAALSTLQLSQLMGSFIHLGMEITAGWDWEIRPTRSFLRRSPLWRDTKWGRCVLAAAFGWWLLLWTDADSLRPLPAGGLWTESHFSRFC